ncbi:hypothetical protein KIH74_22525 [Kineosporia sp. J2-2]|uniref:Uncharacterized protein n=1 Tax=Kineosporia corallincola TaxID=2835133 RepID=A0ABS5TNU9_9ACTN|nr:hypothetical protein [Kineosporia corallincola]MBT0771733.1 hypothetical protein [Kineosporia corallincola]
MTARIWRAGDVPLAPGTRVRALVVYYVPDAEGREGLILSGSRNSWLVDFGEEIANKFGDRRHQWTVTELEVIDDGGEQ